MSSWLALVSVSPSYLIYFSQQAFEAPFAYPLYNQRENRRHEVVVLHRMGGGQHSQEDPGREAG